MDFTETTEAKHRNLRPWVRGQSGNPAGRPRGSRHKIGEDMAAAYAAEWNRSGAEGLTKLAKENFEAFARLGVAIGYFPKDINIDVEVEYAGASSVLEAFRMMSAAVGGDSERVIKGLRKHAPHLLEHVADDGR